MVHRTALFRSMLLLVATAAFFCAASLTSADVYVRGYLRSNGTYVAPHFRSDPDGNFSNNWSTYPNINPYTGSMGTRRTPTYSSPYTQRYYSVPSRWETVKT